MVEGWVEGVGSAVVMMMWLVAGLVSQVTARPLSDVNVCVILIAPYVK